MGSVSIDPQPETLSLLQTTASRVVSALGRGGDDGADGDGEQNDGVPADGSAVGPDSGVAAVASGDGPTAGGMVFEVRVDQISANLRLPSARPLVEVTVSGVGATVELASDAGGGAATTAAVRVGYLVVTDTSPFAGNHAVLAVVSAAEVDVVVPAGAHPDYDLSIEVRVTDRARVLYVQRVYMELIELQNRFLPSNPEWRTAAPFRLALTVEAGNLEAAVPRNYISEQTLSVEARSLRLSNAIAIAGDLAWDQMVCL